MYSNSCLMANNNNNKHPKKTHTPSELSDCIGTSLDLYSCYFFCRCYCCCPLIKCPQLNCGCQHSALSLIVTVLCKQIHNNNKKYQKFHSLRYVCVSWRKNERRKYCTHIECHIQCTQHIHPISDICTCHRNNIRACTKKKIQQAVYRKNLHPTKI